MKKDDVKSGVDRKLFIVGSVATQTEKVVVRDDKQYDIVDLLAECGNDLKKIKDDLSLVLKELGVK